jgi:heme-degrading monooxygenase HmoA
MEKGCQRCDFCESIEDENRLFLVQEWDTQENLRTHLKSEHFGVLRGAMNLLKDKEPYERVFHTVFHPARNTMKSSTKDQAEGTFHEVKGMIKEVAGYRYLFPAHLYSSLRGLLRVGCPAFK